MAILHLPLGLQADNFMGLVEGKRRLARIYPHPILTQSSREPGAAMAALNNPKDEGIAVGLIGIGCAMDDRDDRH